MERDIGGYELCDECGHEIIDLEEYDGKKFCRIECRNLYRFKKQKDLTRRQRAAREIQ